MDQDAGPSSAAAAPAAPPSSTLTDAQRLKQLSAELSALPMREQMRMYYERLFPVQQMHRWLAYGNGEHGGSPVPTTLAAGRPASHASRSQPTQHPPPNQPPNKTESTSTHPAADRAFFQRRELCFTLDGDIFARYQSFPDAPSLARSLRQRVPSKIDIGPVYTYDPRDRAKYGRDFRPVERELVFDVDLTDYDDVRTCGSGGHICKQCWPLMAAAVEVMDSVLRADFGFKHVLWVYSGRRGVHGWVCDAGARQLADEVRAALVGFCSVYRGSEAAAAAGDNGAPAATTTTPEGISRVRLATGSTRHPSVERAYQILRRAWETRVLPAQGLLDDSARGDGVPAGGEGGWARVLQYVPDEAVRQALVKAWCNGRLLHGGNGGDASDSVSVARWHDLVAEVERAAARAARGGGGGGNGAATAAASSRQRAAALNRAVPDIVLAFTYPRLDVEVSKKMNHLLKAPFCVHPKTGRVCVPVEAARVWEFDPEAAFLGGGGGGGGGGKSTGDFAPRLTDLLAEAALAQQKGVPVGPQLWRETGLAPSLRFFEEGFLAPLAAEARAALTAGSKEAGAAATTATRGGAAGLAW